MRCVGIDLGGSAIKAGCVSPAGAILERRALPLAAGSSAEVMLDGIAELARELGADGAIGLGVPGLLDRAGGRIVECPNLHVLEGRELRSELARRLDCDPRDVALENDANAAALGEHWLGAGCDERDFLLVTLGTGIGGGLVLDGELVRGPGGMAGEIGHVVVDPAGELCGCGARGCLETLASARAARRRALAAGLPRQAPGDLIALSARARERDGPERALMFEVGRDLGRGLACALSLLDVRCFVLGGGFGAAADVLESGVRAGLAERSYGRRANDVRVVRARLGADAGWIGAASLCTRERA